MLSSKVPEDIAKQAPDEGSPDLDHGWDAEADVIVVGYGGAGAAAAIEAAERGVSALVVERFAGGGATRMSGGIYYAGGGTDLQKAAGYDDTAEEMFEYLKCETEGEAVPNEVLLDFATRSVENFEWLRARGVEFPHQGFPPIKTSYPSDETTLYYSGNEKSPPYSDRATPAPRGHRPLGPGLTGSLLFDPLRRAAEAAGVQVMCRTRATDLIVDSDGRVIGVEVLELSPETLVTAVHRMLYGLATYGGAMLPSLAKLGQALLGSWERGFSARRRLRARGGVVIASGGFIYNPKWTARYLPKYSKTMRLGTIGDDGSGIELGMRVGANLRKMDRGTAWMFINPPEALPKGLLVDREGQRVCNEELYGAALGEAIAENHEGKALLVIDRKVFLETRNEIVATRKLTFQSFMALVNLYANNRKANTLAELERKLDFPAGALQAAVERYNAGVESGNDEHGKSTAFLQALDTPPYYAVDADTNNWKFLTPSISLGGLDTDGMTGAVLREDGTPIPGLFAAGRAAAGVCSQHYVSGLSIADGVFAGRNAGRSASRKP